VDPAISGAHSTPDGTRSASTRARAKLRQDIPVAPPGPRAVARHLLWRPEYHEVAEVYRQSVRQVSSSALAVVAVLHDAIQRHEWVEQRIIASRASAGVGTVCRVLRRLREAGVVVSDGGEFVPHLGRATCQRHRFVPSEAIVAVTSEDRLLRTDAYVWLTTEDGMAPDDARAMVRRRDYLGAVSRRVLTQAVHMESAPSAPSPTSAKARPWASALAGGTSTRHHEPTVVAPGSTISLAHADPDMHRLELSLSARSESAREDGRRRAWVDEATLVEMEDEMAEPMGWVDERQPRRTILALISAANDGGSEDVVDDVIDAYRTAAGTAAVYWLEWFEPNSGAPFDDCRAPETDDEDHARMSQVYDRAAWAFSVARRRLAGEPCPEWPTGEEQQAYSQDDDFADLGVRLAASWCADDHERQRVRDEWVLRRDYLRENAEAIVGRYAESCRAG
jgi:hypothetical protein